ncbi:helix-turn-helix domain-containing protein [Deinococcus misasensis]|uniref:helix-turn-helix domain-containing protein n=1 Tax=Deinococcus misasensis TaxID=392413 RepID=UPI00054D7EBB|nr:helix-turn-helix domain-containing protein [Deinococcus misasensis]
MGKHQVHLSETEHQQLLQWTQTGNLPAESQIRARILLLTDTRKNYTDIQIVSALHISRTMVEHTRRRYHQIGLEKTIMRAKRKDLGVPVKIDGRVEAHIQTLACSEPPAGYARWTLKMIAAKLVEVVESISTVSVHSTLKKINCNLTESKGS